jgi:hypothetical protein
VWQQAIALLMGLKVRNGIGKKDLAGAVKTALDAEPTGPRCALPFPICYIVFTLQSLWMAVDSGG